MHDANLLNIIVSGVTQPPEAPVKFLRGGAIFRQPTICIGVRDRGVKLSPPPKKKKRWKLGQMLGKIKKILVDSSKYVLNSGKL
jgi:hypothetical protein